MMLQRRIVHSLLLVSMCIVNVQCRAYKKGVHEVCSTNTDCPAHASCKPTSCDGVTCLCDHGFVATEDRKGCVTAVRIGDSCNNTTRCISEYAQCVSGKCRCTSGFQPTKDGRCKLPGTNFVGEPCGTCEFPAQCVSGVCKCAGSFRSLTTEEFWVDPISILQCRPQGYNLETCNGTSVIQLNGAIDKVAEQTSAFSPTNSVGNDWSLILPEKSIYESCNSHSQCPGDSKCRANGCDGFVCLCNVGFIPSEDRLQCLPAKKIGETCDKRYEVCLSPFAKCTAGICKCDSFFSPTIDGRCRVTKTRYVGESCRSSDECEYPGSCVSGKCACVEPHRKITEEEFWTDPALTIQCRPKDSSTWRCNGTIIDIPPQFQADIPIDIEILLTFKNEHKGVEHDDHVEINPTIVVDEPKKEEDYYVPLQIAGILVAAMFALLIACIFKTKRRKAIKRDISLTRTNILANKTMKAAEEEMVNNLHLRMEQAAPIAAQMNLPMTQSSAFSNSQMLVQQMGTLPRNHTFKNGVTLQRPSNVSVYNKNGWHEGFADISFHDNNTDIYPESVTTTRSTGALIMESPKSGILHHGRHNSNGGVGIVAPYTIARNVPFIVDGHTDEPIVGRGVPEQHRQQSVGVHYTNETHEWHPECGSDNEPDLVMF